MGHLWPISSKKVQSGSPMVGAGLSRAFCVGTTATRMPDKTGEKKEGKQGPPVVEISYEELNAMTPEAMKLLRRAFVGPKAYGAIAVTGIPGYAERRKKAFRAGIDLALLDANGREEAAAVSNTYPGWSGTPGIETHPLQSSFLFNVKEEIPGGKTDPFFGKNIFPSKEYQDT
eukprot:gb/GFBE01005723.1/.p1 GENE.gb/GFBE01005723.1/~~gb/GFBE01005723.1/.p1  ORF type:complete len:173 (+),score=30.26 gb/GFBE01005723.1/:2-520(+)